MKFNKVDVLIFTSMNLCVLCLISLIINLIQLNFSNIVFDIAGTYLLYVATVTLKRTKELLKGKEKNGK